LTGGAGQLGIVDIRFGASRWGEVRERVGRRWAGGGGDELELRNLKDLRGRGDARASALAGGRQVWQRCCLDAGGVCVPVRQRGRKSDERVRG
jgi:hypothetical protein